MDGACSRHGTDEKYKVFVGKPEKKRSIVRRRRNNVRMDHREIRWDGVDWIHLAQDRVQW